MTPEQLAGRLGVQVKSRKSNGGVLALCPAHDDRQASLSIDVGTDGKPLIRCMAGCDTDLVLKRAGVTWADLLGSPSAGPVSPPPRRIAATYDYHNASGELLFQVCRFEPKGFAQRRPDGKGGWIYNLEGVEPTLYRLPLLLARTDDLVFLVEGEKDADNLEALDLLATTAPMGAGKWRSSYSEALRGRQVVILPDNDEPGRQHARQVALALQGVAASVKVLELPGLPDKGDVSDWLAAGHSAAELLQLVEAALEWEPAKIIDFPGRQPEFRKAGLGYVFEPAAHPVRITFDYLHRRAYELTAEVSAEQQLPGYEQGRVLRGRVTLTSTASKASFAKSVQSQSDASVPWNRLMGIAADLVVDAERDGEPFVKIGQRPASDEADTWLIHQMLRPGKLMWWYGPRASVKSQTAALMAICLQEGLPFLGRAVKRSRVGILDYEDDDGAWEAAIKAIAQGLGIDAPEIFYRACRVPLKTQANSVARMAASEGLDVLIVDSFGLAAGSTSEHSSFDETALAFGAVQKELGVAMPVIDQVTHAARKNTAEAAEPFGSQYKMALARTGFEIRKVQQEGSNVAHLGIFDRKHGRAPAVGVCVTWQCDGSLTFDLEDLQEQDTELSASLSLPQRIVHFLRHGELTVEELAELMDVKADPIRVALNRGRGKRFTKREQTGAWGLLLPSLPQSEAVNA